MVRVAERVVILDTHPFVWWITEDARRLSRRAATAIDRADRVVLPDIVAFEVALLHDTGRLRLDAPLLVWLTEACAVPRVELCPISPAISAAAMGIRRALGGGDPADHLIAATALRLAAPLVTRDAALSRLGVVETIW